MTTLKSKKFFRNTPITYWCLNSNLITLGSILYHTTLGIFQGSVPVAQRNQDHLAVSMKLKPRTEKLQTRNLFLQRTHNNMFFLVNYITPEEGPKKPVADEEVIKGALSKEELSGLFKSNTKAYLILVNKFIS